MFVPAPRNDIRTTKKVVQANRKFIRTTRKVIGTPRKDFRTPGNGHPNAFEAPPERLNERQLGLTAPAARSAAGKGLAAAECFRLFRLEIPFRDQSPKLNGGTIPFARRHRMNM
jgi:hypothetical protein